MSAAEMREAAALAAHDALFNLCLGTHGGDLSDVTCADVSNAATSAIRALPLPDEEGMVERVARALCQNALAGKKCPCAESGVFNCGDSYPGWQARAAIRVINGGEP